MPNAGAGFNNPEHGPTKHSYIPWKLFFPWQYIAKNYLSLTVDPSAPRSMKNAANCDTYCELQNPVDHRDFERILRPLANLGACPFEHR